ncbi:MAG: hypothetical protein ACLU4N_13800 [Butyricimonas faecihominis]
MKRNQVSILYGQMKSKYDEGLLPDSVTSEVNNSTNKYVWIIKYTIDLWFESVVGELFRGYLDTYQE